MATMEPPTPVRANPAGLRTSLNETDTNPIETNDRSVPSQDRVTRADTTSQESATGAETAGRSDIDQLSNMIQDRLEDRNRLKNIIVIGVLEGYDDEFEVRRLLTQMGFPRMISEIEKRPHRLGTYKYGRNRPLKVEFRSERPVEHLMRFRKSIMDTEDYCYCFINRDLNKRDREIERINRINSKRNNTGSGDHPPAGGNGGGGRHGGAGNGATGGGRGGNGGVRDGTHQQ